MRIIKQEQALLPGPVTPLQHRVQLVVCVQVVDVVFVTVGVLLLGFIFFWVFFFFPFKKDGISLGYRNALVCVCLSSCFP